MHKATVKTENSLLTGRNFWHNQTQGGQPSALIGWGLRGQEKGTMTSITQTRDTC